MQPGCSSGSPAIIGTTRVRWAAGDDKQGMMEYLQTKIYTAMFMRNTNTYMHIYNIHQRERCILYVYVYMKYIYIYKYIIYKYISWYHIHAIEQCASELAKLGSWMHLDAGHVLQTSISPCRQQAIGNKQYATANTYILSIFSIDNICVHNIL